MAVLTESKKDLTPAEMKQALAELPNPQKAAILIMSMGAEAAGAIFRELGEDEVEELTALISEASQVPPVVRRAVLDEFKNTLAQGDFEQPFAVQNILSRALGKDKAEEILGKATHFRNRGELFGFLEDVETTQIASTLAGEQPQTVSLILAHLKPARVAAILSEMTPERQAAVVQGIARMNRVTPSVVRRVEAVLRNQLTNSVQDKPRPIGGTKMIAEILNQADRDFEKRILGELQTKDEEMVEEVKRLMLVFEDLSKLPDSSMQAILREVDMGIMALALKGASDGMKSLVFNNLSKRAMERLKEEIELMGPKMRSEVNEAQHQVLAVARRLEEEGRISIRKGGASGDELLE